MPMTHFERLGLPRRFSIDRAELERLYLARSREVHPDFHAGTSAANQAESLAATAAVNEAYLILKDDFRRADYLLGLLGGPTAGEVKDMPQVFLMEMMEIREQIEEARTSGPNLTLHRLAASLRSQYETLLNQVGQRLEQLVNAEPNPVSLAAIRKDLNAAKVIRGLLRDLDND
jgi:molecular chaperone HscB